MASCILVGQEQVIWGDADLATGHVKAVMIDFGYAKYHGGRCYLR